MMQRGTASANCRDAAEFETKVRLLQEEVEQFNDIVASYGTQEIDSEEDDQGADEFANSHDRYHKVAAAQIPVKYNFKCLLSKNWRKELSIGMSGRVNLLKVQCEICHMDLADPVGRFGRRTYICSAHGSFCLECAGPR